MTFARTPEEAANALAAEEAHAATLIAEADNTADTDVDADTDVTTFDGWLTTRGLRPRTLDGQDYNTLPDGDSDEQNDEWFDDAD